MQFGYIINSIGRVIRILHGTKAIMYELDKRIEYDVKFIEADNWNEAITKIQRISS